jgi:hypothetical protein
MKTLKVIRRLYAIQDPETKAVLGGRSDSPDDTELMVFITRQAAVEYLCEEYGYNEYKEVVKDGWGRVVRLKTAQTPVIKLRLCETEQLVLKPRVLYHFTVDETCKRCKELDAIYNPGTL